MCGIVCIFGIANGGESLRERAVAQARKLRHRGPDWSGIYVKGKNIIAHERLAIMDVDSGDQPLYSEDRSIILGVNGEIYNHDPIRTQMSEKGHKFATKSDCEVIIPLYLSAEKKDHKIWLNELRGMFAFVLYDEKRDCYLAARDHIGIIPLYMGWGRDGSVWFASELKALAEDCERFIEFPPGHFFLSSSSVAADPLQKMEQWYTPTFFVDDDDETHLPTSTALDLVALRESFERSVVSHMMSEVPFGVLLSGGLDSSLVAAIAQRHVRSRHPEGFSVQLHSFAIGLKDSPDLAAAKKVADFIGTKHHNFEFTVQEGIDALSAVIYHLETFDVTTVRASTPMFLLSRKIRAMGIKMLLSGEGSDEIFGGYLYFHKAPNPTEFFKETVRKLKALHLYDCLRANKSTCAWGLEVRVPFLDRDFLDLAMAIDPAEKMVRKGERIEKWILRSAFDVPDAPYLPSEILWRQKEQFSDGVGSDWISGLRRFAAQKVCDEQMVQAPFRFPENTPATKEAYMYRSIFESHFPQPCSRATVPGGPSVACSTPAALLWDESFQRAANQDPSGRSVLGVHHSSC